MKLGLAATAAFMRGRALGSWGPSRSRRARDRQRPPRAGWRSQALRRSPGKQPAQRLLSGHQDLALVREVPEEGAFRDPGALGDLGHRRGVVPLLGEQVDGSHDESFARPWFPPSHRPILAMGLVSHHSDTVMRQESHHSRESSMHVFITGGTGLIGSAVVAELLGNGHTVLALARSDTSALAAQGGRRRTAPRRSRRPGFPPRRRRQGRRGDPPGLRQRLQQSRRSRAGGRRGERRPRDPGRGTRRQRPPLRHGLGHAACAGRVSTEADPLPTDGPVGGRGRSVMAVLGLASRGVRSSAVRLPRTVHNEGKGGFAGMLTDIARRTGVSGYPGDGTQRWPAVHALDAAVLFRLALEQAPAGTSWHAVADEGDAVATSPRSSAGGWLPSRPCHRRPTAPSDRSSRPTSPRPAPTPDRHSAGSRPTRACSRTWRTSSPDWRPGSARR